MPSHLRKFSLGYDLEKWVDGDCPLDEVFELVHPLATRLDGRAFVDASAREAILINLAANVLDVDGSLEDYVFSIDPPLTFHDLSQPGAMAPICEAAGILAVRRYRAAIEKGSWSPSEQEGGAG